MALPILTTKIHIPQTSSLIARPRLYAQLDEHLDKRLVLVSAPAGFGKTTLVSSWVRKHQSDSLRICWLSLDWADNDPARFWIYLIAALRTAYIEIGDATLAALNAPQPLSMEVLLVPLLNELAKLPGDLLLVLDDYHCITAAPIQAGVEFLLEHLPPNIHLLLATREIPTLPLHRLRARAQLGEIQAVDLRFSRSEAVRFLQEIVDLQLSPDDIDVLDARIEGWIAGLQMAALSLKAQPDASAFIRSFSGENRYIFDYLSAEIFEQQPRPVQQFLLRTCILERMCGALCNALMPLDQGDDMAITGHSQAILEDLENANLFVLPLDEQRKWFRYHPLFAETLQRRLQHTHSDWLPQLHLRAADWFWQAGYLSEAVRHALAAPDFGFAARLVEQQGLNLLIRGEVFTLLDWLGHFPPQVLIRYPHAAIYLAWALGLNGQLENSTTLLAQIESQPEVPSSPELTGQIAALRAYMFALQGQIDVAQNYADQALALLSDENVAIRCVVVFTLGGLRYMRGDMSGAAAAFEQAAQDGEAAGNLHVSIPALCALGDMMIHQKQFERAGGILRRALRLGKMPSGKTLPLAGAAYLSLADLTLAQGDRRATRQHLAEGLPLAQLWGHPDNLVSGYLTLAQLELVEGDREAAQKAIQAADSVMEGQSLSPGMPEQVAALKAQIDQKETLSPISEITLIDPLSERELEVLQLMAAGLPNQEIAERLVVALGTVKAHTSSIYRKLEVRGRTQAVVRAQDLGLLK